MNLNSHMGLGYDRNSIIELAQTKDSVFCTNCSRLTWDYIFDKYLFAPERTAPLKMENGLIKSMPPWEQCWRRFKSLWDTHAWDDCYAVAPEIERMIKILEDQNPIKSISDEYNHYVFKGGSSIQDFKFTLEVFRDRLKEVNRFDGWFYKGPFSIRCSL